MDKKLEIVKWKFGKLRKEILKRYNYFRNEDWIISWLKENRVNWDIFGIEERYEIVKRMKIKYRK